MKVDVKELKVRYARTSKGIKDIREKYGASIDDLVNKAFDKDSGMPYFVAGAIVVILHNEKAVATCIYSRRDNTIYCVCVDEEYRHNKLCHKLMEKCIFIMKTDKRFSDNKRYARLFSNNPVAQKIYEHVGFITNNTEPYGELKFYKLDF
jgi:ribosomal protein S18 acetylase RimI-like enzyme